MHAHTGTLYSHDDIVNLAREALDASGLTQREAAERLGVSQPSIAKAVTGVSSMTGVRLRLIGELSGLSLSGPFYAVERS